MYNNSNSRYVKRGRGFHGPRGGFSQRGGFRGRSFQHEGPHHSHHGHSHHHGNHPPHHEHHHGNHPPHQHGHHPPHLEHHQHEHHHGNHPSHHHGHPLHQPPHQHPHQHGHQHPHQHGHPQHNHGNHPPHPQHHGNLGPHSVNNGYQGLPNQPPGAPQSHLIPGHHPPGQEQRTIPQQQYRNSGQPMHPQRYFDHGRSNHPGPMDSVQDNGIIAHGLIPHPGSVHSQFQGPPLSGNPSGLRPGEGPNYPQRPVSPPPLILNPFVTQKMAIFDQQKLVNLEFEYINKLQPQFRNFYSENIHRDWELLRLGDQIKLCERERQRCRDDEKKVEENYQSALKRIEEIENAPPLQDDESEDEELQQCFEKMRNETSS